MRVNTTVYCVVSPLVTVGIQLTVDSYNLVPVLKKTMLCRAVLLVTGKNIAFCVSMTLRSTPAFRMTGQINVALSDFFNGNVWLLATFCTKFRRHCQCRQAAITEASEQEI